MNSKKMALCAIIVALSTVIMYIASFTPTMSLTLAAIAGVLLSVIVIECGDKAALTAFVATSVLAGLLIPDKGVALVYFAFFGNYAIVKEQIERIRRSVIEWILKPVYFNIVIIAAYFLSKLLVTDVFDMGDSSIWIILILGNAAFVLYDIGLTKLITYYIRKLKGKMKW